RDILDRDDGDALEPPPVRPAVAGEPAVVEAGELGRETRILDARQGERDVGGEHHRLDPLAIRVGEHALGRERVGAAGDAEALIADDSSLARKRATLAISAGRRLRPRACIAATSSSERPPKTASRSRAGVRTAPGQMQLARMFFRPYSSATERVRLIMPPLAVLYGLPRMPP